MKVLVIYASKDGQECAENIRSNLSIKYGEDTVLRVDSVERKKSFISDFWHRDAINMMRQADLIVYVLSESSVNNKNINWELNTAIKLNKYIVCVPSDTVIYNEKEKEYKLNNCLYYKDPNTKLGKTLCEMINMEKLYAIIDEFNNNEYIGLFKKDSNFNEAILLEQYKIFSDTAENLVTRRQNVNSFYISANTAIITIGGTIFALGSDADIMSKLIVIIVLTVPGFLLNVSWFKMLQSYFINNQGKMKILSMIEEKLAVSLYDAEWRAMQNRYSKKKYVSFTDNESSLPKVFCLFYTVVAIISLFYVVSCLIK